MGRLTVLGLDSDHGASEAYVRVRLEGGEASS